MEDIGLLLQLTAIGMGITFLALGLLVLVMIVLTRIVKEKPPVAELVIPEEKALPVSMETTSKVRAAAAAVAVALALSKGKQRAAAAAVAVAFAKQDTASTAPKAQVSGWDSSIRSRQVTQRDRFASQRRMRQS